MTDIEARKAEIQKQRRAICAVLVSRGYLEGAADTVATAALYALDVAGYDVIKREPKP